MNIPDLPCDLQPEASKESAYREASRELVRHFILAIGHILDSQDARQGAIEMVHAYGIPVDPATERRARAMLGCSRQAISKNARAYVEINGLPKSIRMR